MKTHYVTKYDPNKTACGRNVKGLKTTTDRQVGQVTCESCKYSRFYSAVPKRQSNVEPLCKITGRHVRAPLDKQCIHCGTRMES